MKTNLILCMAMIAAFVSSFTSAAIALQDESPRSLSGFGESESYDLVDDVVLDFKDANIIKLLYLVKKISQKNFERYSEYTRNIGLEDLKENPQKHRLWLFNIKGIATRVSQNKYEGKNAEELKGCFQIDFETENGNLVLITRELPRDWKIDAPINEKSSFYGFFIAHRFFNADARQENKTLPVFVSLRPSWYPDATSKIERTQSLDESHRVLASSGVDVGLLDYVRRQSFRRLGKADSMSFYQFLAATKKMQPADVPAASLSFVDMMSKPKVNFGHATNVSGRVRRCFRVEVENAEMRERFGIDHYYELDMFHALGDGRVTTKNKEGKKVVFEDRFPMTVCVSKLPEGLTPEDVADHTVHVSGFYYRFWSYHSEFSAEQSSDPAVATQAAPLVIGVIDTVVEASTETLDFVLTGFVVAILLGTIGLLWFFRRSDRKSPHAASRRAELPSEVDFSGVED